MISYLSLTDQIMVIRIISQSKLLSGETPFCIRELNQVQQILTVCICEFLSRFTECNIKDKLYGKSALSDVINLRTMMIVICYIREAK